MSGAPWKELLDELRSLRSESARSEDEMWSAIEEIRELLRGSSGAHSAVLAGAAGARRGSAGG